MSTCTVIRAVGTSAMRRGGSCMVRPAQFGYNAQTAAQQSISANRIGGVERPNHARSEFASFAPVHSQTAGVRTCVVDDTPSRPSPMPYSRTTGSASTAMAPSCCIRCRRRIGATSGAWKCCRRSSAVRISAAGGCSIFSARGTARPHARGHRQPGARSRAADGLRLPVAHAPMSRWFANGRRLMSYEPLLFDARGADGTPIYHTNVHARASAHAGR